MTVADDVMLEPEPIEVDPPTCELCGCTIEDLEELIYLRAADLVTQWELADPRVAWRHTGDPRPKCSSAEHLPSAKPYRTPQSTVDAFWYVATHEPDKLKAWLARHPDDAPALHRIWKAKRCS
jgi:hypothetical protein